MANFLNLSRLKDAASLPSEETLIPFAQEPEAHTVNTWVRAGEAPLRIYKNGYDKPPPSYVPAYDNCVQSHESFDEVVRIMKENGWDKPRSVTYDPSALEDCHPILRNLRAWRDDPTQRVTEK